MNKHLPIQITALTTALALLSGCGATKYWPAPTEKPYASNISAPDLGKLFSNHVYISHLYTNKWHGSNIDNAIAGYYSPDGHVEVCGIDMRHKRPKTMQDWDWHVRDEPGWDAEICAPDANSPHMKDHVFCRPLNWDPVSGRTVDLTEPYKYLIDYSLRRVGHVQASWPRVMLERCPDLKLPPDLPINEKQTSPRYAELVAQDPDAVLTGADLGITELPDALLPDALPPLAGRAVVLRKTIDHDMPHHGVRDVIPDPNSPIKGFYILAFTPDHGVRACGLTSTGYEPWHSTYNNYEMVHIDAGGGTNGFWFQATGGPGNGRFGAWTSWYDGPDGLDIHASSRSKDYINIYDGWLQEGIPALFADACGDMFIDGVFAVNGDQSKPDFDDLKAHAERVGRSLPVASGSSEPPHSLGAAQ